MIKTIFIALFSIVVSSIYGQTSYGISAKTIQLTASDGLPVTADSYITTRTDAPLIILFHQARYSRGEYKSIAIRLNILGFNCLAIDQRSGNEVNGIRNQTHTEAIQKGFATEYIDALPDMEAALEYANNTLKAKTIIIWGSSYSSSLVFYLAQKYSDIVKGVLSFSPGEYFTVDTKNIASFAAGVKCPVFITSAKDEQSKWQNIFDSITSEKYYFLPKDKGKHGSKALWSNNPSQKEYWDAVTTFLNLFHNK